MWERALYSNVDSLLLDRDECLEHAHQCAQNCHNTNGSYNCSCNAGYNLSDAGYDCDGIWRVEKEGERKLEG